MNPRTIRAIGSLFLAAIIGWARNQEMKGALSCMLGAALTLLVIEKLEARKERR